MRRQPTDTLSGRLERRA